MGKKISNPPPPAGIVKPPPPPNPPRTETEQIAENIRRMSVAAWPTAAEAAANLRRVYDLISGREEMTENALQIARQEKKRVESIIQRELDTFNQETGLMVTSVNLERIELTCRSDQTPRFAYRVTCEVAIE